MFLHLHQIMELARACDVEIVLVNLGEALRTVVECGRSTPPFAAQVVAGPGR